MKFITLAAIAALTATPVMAQSIQDEQSRADYHQAKADAERAQIQKEDAQAQAGSAAADAASSQAQANAAQCRCQQVAGPGRCGEDRRPNRPRTRPTLRRPKPTVRQAQADQARADRNAALDRAAEARTNIENQ